jgi:hypothetical protein
MRTEFKPGMILEIIDKNKLSQIKIARIIENVGGRLRLKYENINVFDDFWCHQNSQLIHPIGWASSVGHDISEEEGN